MGTAPPSTPSGAQKVWHVNLTCEHRDPRSKRHEGTTLPLTCVPHKSADDTNLKCASQFVFAKSAVQVVSAGICAKPAHFTVAWTDTITTREHDDST